MQKPKWLVWFGSALILGGAAVLGHYSWTLHETNYAQESAKEWLDRTRENSTRMPELPMHRGDVIGEIEIPRLHLSVMVFEGDDAEVLKQGAGHIPGTDLPSGSGNIGIAAHRDTYFRPLRMIHTNDVIALKTQTGTSRYAVVDTEIVRPRDVGVLAPAPGRALTLVTCYPFFYVGPAPHRFIVHARKIG